ncbi:hypothetical protein [Pseudoteredinibacter isoporae]|uniref:hypothetical protein n=1 Tax=Pseudoteredinibacter isoporae TaxID=570281 RepID=UPI003106DDE3
MDNILGVQLTKYSLSFTSPCYFGNPNRDDAKVNNGTVTLIKFRGERFGLTCFHVINEYRKRVEEEGDVSLYIGNILVELDEIWFDENEGYDLCTLYLEPYAEEKFGAYGEVPTHFFELEEFTNEGVEIGNFVLWGGYPGVWRERPSSDNVIFDTISSGSTLIDDAAADIITCRLEVDKCLITIQNGRDMTGDLGGISGGPLFLHKISSAGISSFSLVGIIYQYSPNVDVLLSRPVTLIRDNLWLNG